MLFVYIYIRNIYIYIFSREGWFPWNILQTGKSMHISETQPLFVPEYALGERSSLPPSSSFPLLLSRSFAFPLTSSLQPNNTLLPLLFSFSPYPYPLSSQPPFSLFPYPGICLILTISALSLSLSPPVMKAAFEVFQDLAQSTKSNSQRREKEREGERDNLLSNASNSMVVSTPPLLPFLSVTSLFAFIPFLFYLFFNSRRETLQ